METKLDLAKEKTFFKEVAVLFGSSYSKNIILDDGTRISLTISKTEDNSKTLSKDLLLKEMELIRKDLKSDNFFYTDPTNPVVPLEDWNIYK